MKTSNRFFVPFRTLTTMVLAIVFASVSLKAQIPTANQPIRIATLPSSTLSLLSFVDTKVINLPTQVLGAPLNSAITGLFKVPADGNIKLKVTLKHVENQPVNHTVRIELINPTGGIADKEPEIVVLHNSPKTVYLNAVATSANSGCTGLNTWKFRVINNDNVNHQATEVSVSATVPDATGFRNIFPSGGYTLSQNAFGDFVFATPKGHNGSMKIKVTYDGASTVEARLFKPGVEPSPNEANATTIKSITASGQTMSKSVAATDVNAANQFWTVRLRNKTGTQVSNAKITVEFTDCFE